MFSRLMPFCLEPQHSFLHTGWSWMANGRSVSCLVEVVIVVVVLMMVMVLVSLYHLSHLAFIQDDGGEVSHVFLFQNCPRSLEGFTHLVSLFCPLLVFLVSLLRLHGEVRKVLTHPGRRRSHWYRCPLHGSTPYSPSCIHWSGALVLSLGGLDKVPACILTPQPLLYLRKLCIGSFH